MVDVPWSETPVRLEEVQLYAIAVILVVIAVVVYAGTAQVYRLFFTDEFDYDIDILEKEKRGGNPASGDSITRMLGSKEKRARLKALRVAEQERAALRAAGDDIPEELEEEIKKGQKEFPKRPEPLPPPRRGILMD
jgi:hypothetical protein